MSDMTHIQSLLHDGRKEAPHRLCKIVYAAGITGFFIVEFVNGKQGLVHDSTLTKIKDASKERIVIEQAEKTI